MDVTCDCGRQISWLLFISLALSADQQQLHGLKRLGLTFLCFNRCGWNSMHLTCLMVLMLPQVTLQLLYQWFLHSSCLRTTKSSPQPWLTKPGSCHHLFVWEAWTLSPCGRWVLKSTYFVPLSVQKFQPKISKHFLLNYVFLPNTSLTGKDLILKFLFGSGSSWH